MNLSKGQISNLSEFDMVIDITPPNSGSNFFSTCIVKSSCSLNVLDKALQALNWLVFNHSCSCENV